LVALDLDGTILDMKLNLDPRDVEALGQIIFAGVTVVACTGRPFPGALPWVERLGLDGPIICYQGAEIRLPDGTKILDHGVHHAWSEGYVPVNRAFADAVIDELDRDADAAVFFHDYHLYVAPRFVRDARPDARLVQFVHIPWPGTDSW